MTRATRIRIAVYGTLSLILMGLAGAIMWAVVMPGESYEGEPPELTSSQKEQAKRLEKHVQVLAGPQKFPRNQTDETRYLAARDYLVDEIAEIGFEAQLEEVPTGDETWFNVWVELPGASRADEVVVVGGHYDTAFFTPGADDNASGTAGTLEVLRHFATEPSDRTIVFYFFANEEPPHFRTSRMGSYVAANRDWGGRSVVAMLSIEMIGYFSDEPGSQKYPWPLDLLYPDQGNFIAFVTTTEHRALVTDIVAKWRSEVAFPSEGIAGPRFIPGIDFSDHAPFLDAGIPAVMVTDTAFNRNDNYHKATDTPDTLDYERMSRVVDGVKVVVKDLAGEAN